MTKHSDYINYQRRSTRIRRASISERKIQRLYRTREIRFNGRLMTLPHSVNQDTALVRIYFYWPARSAWHAFDVPFSLYNRTLTYRFAPIDN